MFTIWEDNVLGKIILGEYVLGVYVPEGLCVFLVGGIMGCIHLKARAPLIFSLIRADHMRTIKLLIQ